MKKYILVTGSHRSGSTWTGTVISRADKVRYAHEPFNPAISRKNSPFNYWFEHLNDSPIKYQRKAKNYIDSLCRVFNLYNLNRIGQIRSFKGIYYYLADLKGRWTDRTIIKDPIAIMSAEWIYKTFKADIVVLIRHPAAFVASIKLKNWEFDFNNYLKQPVLMKNYLKNYETLIQDYSDNKKDIIDQGILLWNTIYDVVAYYQSKYKDDWYFVKHEDLSMNPLVEFEKMFSKINLTLDANVRKYINETTMAKEESDLKRNSNKNVNTWRNRLSDDEIQRVKTGTEKVWRKFYSDSDW